MAARATTTTRHAPPPTRLTSRSIPLDVEVPAEVREATSSVHRAEQRIAEVRDELRDAQRQLVQAPRADRRAALDAERELRPIPEPTVPKLEARVEQLDRELRATQDALRAASREQDAATAATLGDWHERAVSDVEGLLEEQRELLDRLDDLEDRLALRGAVVTALDAFAQYQALMFHWPTAGQAAQQREKMHEQLAKRVRRPNVSHAELLAELELLSRRALGKVAEQPRTYGRAAFGGGG
jgi:chromosome segregation ATPase